MTEAQQPEFQIGTLFADPIRASSLLWLHQQAGQKTAPDQSARTLIFLLQWGSHPQRSLALLQTVAESGRCSDHPNVKTSPSNHNG